jgi:peptidoglycan/xylan/chitin deacetylase (PgdA/CDA1 family)
MNRRASPIFLYHGAEENGGDAIRDPLYSLPPALIRAQVAALREAGFSSVTLGEFLARGGDCAGGCVITIDDGLLSAATVLFPALAEAGFTAVIFPVAGMVGRKGWVDWAALAEMRQAGFEVGSHGMTHASLAGASAREELAASKRLIEDRLGAPVNYLALPGGYRNRATASRAAEAGYAAICGSRFGYNRVPADPMDLKRICLRRGDGPEAAAAFAAGALRGIAGRFARERGKEIGRAILGRRIYAALRGRLIPEGAHPSLPRFPRDD